MLIKVKRTENHIIISSPYCPDLPDRARGISGKCSNEKGTWTWIYPMEAEPQVAELYLDCFGEWDTPVETVEIKCIVGDRDEYTDKVSLTLASRVIASAELGYDNNDAGTAHGVIVLEGGFTKRGKLGNRTTVVKAGSCFKVLGVPRQKAEALVQSPEWCKSIAIVDSAPDVEALKAEKERLLARIAEIEKIIVG